MLLFYVFCFFFFFKQKTAYEMRISDWSSDVCSSDLVGLGLWEIMSQAPFSGLWWNVIARPGRSRPGRAADLCRSHRTARRKATCRCGHDKADRKSVV